MSTAKTCPKTWPGTSIIKSLHTPFNWRTAGMDPRPLNAGIQPSAPPRNLGGRTSGKAFGHEGGTMPHLAKQPSVKAAKILATRPAHVGFVIPKPSTTERVRTLAGGYVSKAVTT